MPLVLDVCSDPPTGCQVVVNFLEGVIRFRLQAADVRDDAKRERAASVVVKGQPTDHHFARGDLVKILRT